MYAKDEDDGKLDEYVREAIETLDDSAPDFTMEELLKAIKHLKNNKAAGPDRIPAEILKACPKPVLEIILKLMNKIKNSSQYPNAWALGITSLLFKEGNDEDPNNYRAITVCDAISKILAIMLNDRLEVWSNDNDKVKVEQIGFQKFSRPSDHLFVLRSLIDAHKNQGKKLYACFVDFRKAFDTVWRTGLIYKLIQYKMNITYIKLIKNMYEKTGISLKMNSIISRPVSVGRGVRQGCILSPRLFNLFINDIPDIFDASCCPVGLDKKRVNCLMFADDLVILSESPAGLQNCLNKLESYIKKWKLEVNLKKTKIMIFQNPGKRPEAVFYLGDKQVEVSHSYKYLGTIITDTGNFKANEVNLKKKGLRASYIILKNIGMFSKPSTSIHIFEKIVEPILTYNSEVAMAYFPLSWDQDKFTENMWDIGIEPNKVILSFLRQILGVHKKTSNIAILSETGKYPISIKIFNAIIKYWLRLHASNNTLLSEALTLNVKQSQKNRQNWTRMVMYLLSITKNTQKPSKNPKENNKILSNFKIKIKQCFEQWWQIKRINTGKLDFFFIYKKSIQM